MNTQSSESLIAGAKKYKLVGFEDILKMSNPENKKNGEIALTILTPKQVIHAIPYGDCPDLHGKLAPEIYKEIFGVADNDFSKYCVEIRHSIFSKDNSFSIVFSPKFITPDEFASLKDFIAILLTQGTDVHGLFSDFDPRTASLKEPAKLIDEREMDEVLDYLIDRVMEYELPFEERILEATKEKANNI